MRAARLLLILCCAGCGAGHAVEPRAAQTDTPRPPATRPAPAETPAPERPPAAVAIPGLPFEWIRTLEGESSCRSETLNPHLSNYERGRVRRALAAREGGAHHALEADLDGDGAAEQARVEVVSPRYTIVRVGEASVVLRDPLLDESPVAVVDMFPNRPGTLLRVGTRLLRYADGQLDVLRGSYAREGDLEVAFVSHQEQLRLYASDGTRRTFAALPASFCHGDITIGGLGDTHHRLVTLSPQHSSRTFVMLETTGGVAFERAWVGAESFTFDADANEAEVVTVSCGVRVTRRWRLAERWQGGDEARIGEAHEDYCGPRPTMLADLDGDGVEDWVVVGRDRVRVGDAEAPIRGLHGRAELVDVDTRDGRRELLFRSCEDDTCEYRLLAYVGGRIIDLFGGDVGGRMTLDGNGRAVLTDAECGRVTTTTFRLRRDRMRQVSHRVRGRYDEDACVACPFVYAAGALEGEILRELRAPGLEAWQPLTVTPQRGARYAFTIREEKAETTYLDALTLRVGDLEVAPDGCEGGGELCDDDGVYLVLRRGDEVRITFTTPAGLDPVSAARATLFANGYYLPDP